MTLGNSEAFVEACSKLVGQIAAHHSLADAIVASVRSEKLSADTGPVGIEKVLKGAPGAYYLKEFLHVWSSSVPHLSPQEVAIFLEAALRSYQLALSRAHVVDSVWTGPEINGSEVRRTNAVVNEIVSGAEKEILIVGYWLVTRTAQISALINLLAKKSKAGVRVRFVFDPGIKSGGPDNFTALNALWPTDLTEAPLEVFSWSESSATISSKTGQQFQRKLHAKVIVADRWDALVTSANLSHAGLLENLEMGLRVRGSTAGTVVRHFELLVQEGILDRRG